MNEQLPVNDESVVEGVAEQPTIHDQAYWDQDAETAAQNWERFRATRLVEMGNEQMTALIGYMWKQLWVDHQLIRQLALETPVTPEVKPARRRAKVPKTALPELEGDPDAA